MRMLISLAGAAMLVATVPAVAKTGNDHANGKSGHATSAHGTSGHATKVHAKSGHASTVRGSSDRGIIRTSNGRLYAMDTRGSCPPGLAKKGNGCLPPGQAKKLYNVGQRYNQNFGDQWSYNQVPEYLRNQYSLGRDDQYYYRNGYVYQVDPKTMLVQQVISALLR